MLKRYVLSARNAAQMSVELSKQKKTKTVQQSFYFA